MSWTTAIEDPILEYGAEDRGCNVRGGGGRSGNFNYTVVGE